MPQALVGKPKSVQSSREAAGPSPLMTQPFNTFGTPSTLPHYQTKKIATYGQVTQLEFSPLPVLGKTLGTKIPSPPSTISYGILTTFLANLFILRAGLKEQGRELGIVFPKAFGWVQRLMLSLQLPN
ncbi:hypothetical protein OIU77_001140 [Salix suchowensis]|uniref:Uncharacterized protein n=1 Tax=Salix suchowensis TaxID=1278906 RepID=A0ABQ8ZG97_9ROSI|nr:hypothetical protein OIU77_001140 [Salix suchowensis]